MASQVILLEDGWNKLKSGGVNKIEAILEDMHGGVYKDKISTEEYSALYTTVYTMCTQKPPNNWSEHLYNNYCDAVKDYLSARILPRIKEKHDEAMLTELVRRWENHKLMCARASPAAAAAAALSLSTSLGTLPRTSTHFSSHHAAVRSLSLSGSNSSPTSSNTSTASTSSASPSRSSRRSAPSRSTTSCLMRSSATCAQLFSRYKSRACLQREPLLCAGFGCCERL